MKTVWHREIELAAQSYRDEAEQRRRLSKVDPVADALDFVAADLKKRVEVLAAPTATRSVEEWAAEQNPPVSAQTVRNWIRAGELEAFEDGRGYKIPIDARRQMKRAAKQEDGVAA